MRSFCINPFTAIGLGIGLGLGTVAITQATLAQLQASALRQCALRDWPTYKDAAMSAWCSEFKTTYIKYGRY